jgi:signal transduction histidine kinase/CheY-like chemotaxis protein
MARPLPRRTLRGRLIQAGVIPGAVMSLVLTTGFTWERIHTLERNFADEGEALAHHVAYSAALALYAGDPVSVRSIAQATMQEPRVIAAELSNDQGMRIALGEPAAPVQHTRSFIAPVSLAALRRLSDYPGLGDQEGARRIIGSVRITLDTRALEKSRLQALLIDALATLGSFIFAAGLARLTAGRIARPLQRLRSAVSSIRAGNFDVHIGAADTVELQVLAEGVGSMANSLRRHRQATETQVREATAQALERLRQAEQANLSKTRFLAAASHDLRQPLHALGFFVAGLRETALPEQQAVIGKIESGLQSLSNLLSALLDMSRLEADVLRPEMRPVSLRQLFDEVADLAQPAAQEQGIELRFSGRDRLLSTDPLLLARLLNNLVANALKHSGARRVLVAARRSGGRTRIEVRDNGVGIAPLYHERIFDEFFQIDNPERDRGKGLGLGLSICRRIARLLGSDIRLRSALWEGATFAIELPNAAEAAAAVPAAKPAAPAPRGGLRGLLVDDDEPICEATATWLRQWGCLVDIAASAGQAIGRLEQSPAAYDFVLTDLQLEAADDGWRVIEAAGRCNPPPRLLLMSGNTEPTILREAGRRRVTLLTKPIAPARLRAVLMMPAG